MFKPVLGFVIIALVVTAGHGASTDRERRILSNIELGEFTDPLWLDLDLQSGKYVIVARVPPPPPPGALPAQIISKPRSGVLRGDTLQVFRKLFDAAWQAGLSDWKCLDEHNRSGIPFPPRMAPIAEMTLITEHQAKSLPEGCLTPTAGLLSKAVFNEFDYKNP